MFRSSFSAYDPKRTFSPFGSPLSCPGAGLFISIVRRSWRREYGKQSFLDMIEEFGTGLGVPKVDVDKLIEVHRRNIDALGRSAQVATEGAKSLADKQRGIIETAFRETSAMVRDFKPTGNPQEMLVKQTEFAKKAFDITLQNTRDIAELAMKTTSDATAIVRERLRESLSELRDSVSLAGSEMPKKK